jgi:hypothetical protein
VNDRGRRIPSQREVSLVEVLDRALGAGVVITGDVTISLADIDLVYLNLRVLLGSVGTIKGERRYDPGERDPEDRALTLGSGTDGRP